MPVLDHEVHASTRKKSSDPYGCCNRKMKRGYYIKERVYAPSGTYLLINRKIRHTMSTECRHDNSLKDPGCATCKHRGSGEKYAESVRASC